MYASAKHVCRRARLHAVASEYMSFVPVLGKWVENVVMRVGVLAPECKSMLLLVDTVESVMLAVHGKGSPDALESKIYAHAKEQQQVNGTTC